MARLAVRIDDFEDGRLPSCCASTGGEPDRLYRIEARYHPGWPLVFLLLGPIGVVIALVVAAGVSRQVSGLVPLTDDAHQRAVAARRAATEFAVGALVLTVALVVALVRLGHGAPAVGAGVIGVAVTAWCAVSASRPPGSIGASLDRNGRSVHLTDVAPGFAAAYRAQERDRRFDRRP